MTDATEKGRPLCLRRIAFGTVLLVVVPLVLLLVLEIFCRVWFAYQVGPSVLVRGLGARVDSRFEEESVENHFNVVGEFDKYHPHQSRYGRDPKSKERFKVRINNWGYRGADFTAQKPADTIRVATLGSSSTFGFYNRDETTYPRYLEDALNQRCPDQRYEVLNLGIPHLPVYNIYHLFSNDGVALQPDIVTLYEGGNDSAGFYGVQLSRPRPVRDRLGRVKALRMVDYVLSFRSVFYQFCKSVFEERDNQFTREEVERHAEGKSEHFLTCVAKIRAVCIEHNARFIVATQQINSSGYRPTEDAAKARLTYEDECRYVLDKIERGERVSRYEANLYVHHGMMRDLRAWAAENDVPLADAILALDHRREVLVSWLHLSPEGNRMIAGVLAETILADGCTQ